MVPGRYSPRPNATSVPTVNARAARLSSPLRRPTPRVDAHVAEALPEGALHSGADTSVDRVSRAQRGPHHRRARARAAARLPLGLDGGTRGRILPVCRRLRARVERVHASGHAAHVSGRRPRPHRAAHPPDHRAQQRPGVAGRPGPGVEPERAHQLRSGLLVVDIEPVLDVGASLGAAPDRGQLLVAHRHQRRPRLRHEDRPSHLPGPDRRPVVDDCRDGRGRLLAGHLVALKRHGPLVVLAPLTLALNRHVAGVDTCGLIQPRLRVRSSRGVAGGGLRGGRLFSLPPDRRCEGPQVLPRSTTGATLARTPFRVRPGAGPGDDLGVHRLQTIALAARPRAGAEAARSGPAARRRPGDDLLVASEARV